MIINTNDLNTASLKMLNHLNTYGLMNKIDDKNILIKLINIYLTETDNPIIRLEGKEKEKKWADTIINMRALYKLLKKYKTKEDLKIIVNTRSIDKIRRTNDHLMKEIICIDTSNDQSFGKAIMILLIDDDVLELTEEDKNLIIEEVLDCEMMSYILFFEKIGYFDEEYFKKSENLNRFMNYTPNFEKNILLFNELLNRLFEKEIIKYNDLNLNNKIDLLGSTLLCNNELLYEKILNDEEIINYIKEGNIDIITKSKLLNEILLCICDNKSISEDKVRLLIDRIFKEGWEYEEYDIKRNLHRIYKTKYNLYMLLLISDRESLCLEYILKNQHSFDVNFKNRNNISLLHIALKYDKLNLVYKLLELYPEIDLETRVKITNKNILDLFMEKNLDDQCIELFNKSNNKESLLLFEIEGMNLYERALKNENLNKFTELLEIEIQKTGYEITKECIVCLENFHMRDSIKVRCCKGYFHGPCHLHFSSKQKKYCLICRTNNKNNEIFKLYDKKRNISTVLLNVTVFNEMVSTTNNEVNTNESNSSNESDESVGSIDNNDTPIINLILQDVNTSDSDYESGMNSLYNEDEEEEYDDYDYLNNPEDWGDYDEDDI